MYVSLVRMKYYADNPSIWIKNVKNPIDRLNAVNKAYADRIKYKTASDNIPNTVLTDHILFTIHTFASGKIKICEM